MNFLMMFVGYLAWVLAEYWMHRHLFHRLLYRRAHWVHHLRPRSEEGSPPTGFTHLTLGALAAALAHLLGYPGIALGAGFLIGYLTYIVPHHFIHRQRWWQNTSMAKRHALHHKGVEANFNVLCPLGDLLFGTYQRP